MNSYQKFFSAIKFENGEIPVAPFLLTFAARFDKCSYSDYCTDAAKLAHAQIVTRNYFEFDYVTVASDAYREASAFGANVCFPHDDVPYLKEIYLKNLKDSKHLKISGINNYERLKDRLNAVKILKEKFAYSVPVIGWIESPLAEAGILRGPSNLMLDLIDSGSELKKLIKICSDVAIEFAIAQIEVGADIMGIGESIASLISPGLYREFSLPFIKKMVDEIKKFGVPIKYHTCGNTSHLLSAFLETGVDIIVIDSPVDLRLAKEVFKNVICIKGNLNPVDDLLNDTPQSVYKKSINAIKRGGPEGYILSGGCEIPAATPHNNLFSMIRATRDMSLSGGKIKHDC
jgi:MtaA/CmuA family methyltransferase